MNKGSYFLNLFIIHTLGKIKEIVDFIIKICSCIFEKRKNNKRIIIKVNSNKLNNLVEIVN